MERGTIISVISQKGGTGKTTICENIAVALAQMKKMAEKRVDVMIMDCDYGQLNISKWVQRRNDTISNGEKLQKIHSSIYKQNIKEGAIDLASRYDVVLIDPDGRDGTALRQALLVSDIIYISAQPTQNDLETLEKIVELIKETKELNPKRIIKIILTRTPTHPTNSDRSLAEKYIEEIGDSSVSLSQAYISDRLVYKRAPVEGKGVLESDDNKAKAEINKLIKEIIENV